MYSHQPSETRSVVGDGGDRGAQVPPTVTPTATIAAPASAKYWSAAISALVVFVVPNGSTQVDAMKPIRLPLSAFGSSADRQSAGVCRPGADVSGFAGSTATTTLRMSARAGAERGIAPLKSERYVSGWTPVPLSRPLVPRSVTRLAALEGP